MSVPEKPYTRKEAYLNAAATGDTSGIPETPYTREEMYLEAIARNGGGGGGGGGSSSLSGLTDVDISNPTDGQTLVYNATSGKWENGQGSSGGGVLVVTAALSDNTMTLDKTWQEIYDADAVSIVMVEGDGKSYAYCNEVFSVDSDYIVIVAGSGGAIQLRTNSASGYPSSTME